MHIRFVDKHKDNSLFFSTLRQRVDQYFKERGLSRNANAAMVTKTVVLLSAYILPFVAILLFPMHPSLSFVLWSIMGMALAGIGMSIMHDANHGAYSRNARVNYWLGHTLNLLGGSVHNWKLQHNVLHHTYTNITDKDEDIDDKLVMRFSPHKEVRWYHKFQFVYAFAFYGILTLYWAFLKDFIQFARYNREGVNTAPKDKNTGILVRLIIAKIAYVFVFIVFPLFILDVGTTSYLLGFFWMHFLAGLFLTTVFQLAHTVENTTHPLPNDSGVVENSWAVHQMNTTVNFSRNNKWISWYVGGLNFQVEHHLFPNICHVHYPAIAPIVKATAEEFGIPYLENPTFVAALQSHIRLLRRFGYMPSLNEALA